MIDRTKPADQFTVDNITDEHIRDLRNNVEPLGVADILCCMALGIALPNKTASGDSFGEWDFDPSDPVQRRQARARCAEILNACKEGR